MKALVFEAPERAVVSDLEPPAIGPDEVLVRSHAVGICHSDFELLAGHYIIPVSYPIIPGHEWAGEVVEVGSSVSGFSPGGRVVGECVVGPGGRDHFGFSISGANAEYFRARAEWLHILPEGLSYTAGALVEPFSVAHNARVTLIEPQQSRRAKALDLGARSALDPGAQDFAEAVAGHTAGRGFDVVLEAAGAPPAMASALELAAHSARIVFIGIDVGSSAPAKLGLIQSKALRIRGIIGSAGLWPSTIRFLASGVVDPSMIVTAQFPLPDALAALDAARDTAHNVKVHIQTG